MRILCVCNHGNNRSVALSRMIHELNGPCRSQDLAYLDKYAKFEAVPVGLHCTPMGSLKHFIDWAEYVIDLSDSEEGTHKRLRELSQGKYRQFDVGVDTWGNPLAPELISRLQPLVEKIRAGDMEGHKWFSLTG